jgi:subtilisin family serine protease
MEDHMKRVKRKRIPLLILVFSILFIGASAHEITDTKAVTIPIEEDGTYTRVMVKLNVAGIDALKTKARQYKAVKPGESFPAAGFQADLDVKTAIQNTADAVLLQLNGKGYTLTRRYSVIPYLALEVSKEARMALESFWLVDNVRESKSYVVDNPTYYQSRQSQSASGVSGSTPGLSTPKLDNTANIVGASDAKDMGFTGEGYYVAVLDTGILNSHDFFTGKDIVEHCFSIESQCPNGSTEDDGPGSAAHHDPMYAGWQHGSVVTGIAAGRNGYPPGYVEPIHGVARDSDIIAVQVCSYYATCLPFYPGACVVENEEDVLSGLEYVYGLRGSYPIAAVNLSLGDMEEHGAACDGDPNWGIITGIVTDLKNVGIATIAASGNDSYCYGINAPACISDVIAVGGSTDFDVEWAGSSWHSTLQNLFAPAQQVLSADGGENDDYIGTWSGTSLAAPHVVGAFALMKQACPEATVDEILTALETTGYPIAPSGCGSQPTTPRIQINDAIDALTDSITVTSPTPGVSYGRLYTLSIDWTTCGFSGDVAITAESGSTIVTIQSAYPHDGGPVNWTVPYNFPTGTCRIKVSQDPVTGESDDFNIGAIKVTYPRGGQIVGLETTVPIQWIPFSIPGNVKIIAESSQGDYILASSYPAGDSPFNWYIPEWFPRGNCRIKIVQDYVVGYTGTFQIYGMIISDPW